MVFAEELLVRIKKKNTVPMKIYEYTYWYLRHRLGAQMNVENVHKSKREWRMYLGKDIPQNVLAECIREAKIAKPWIDAKAQSRVLSIVEANLIRQIVEIILEETIDGVLLNFEKERRQKGQ